MDLVRDRRRAALLLSLAFASGCLGYRVEIVDVPPIDPWQDSEGLGTICVLRPQTFGAVAQAVHLDNGRVVGATQGGRVYLCYHAEPGPHRLVARTDNDAELAVEVLPGRPAFVRLQLGMGPDHLLPVDEAEARRMLDQLDYVVARPGARDVEPVTTEPVPALAP